eukprot:191942-Amphidinium_carterae.1
MCIRDRTICTPWSSCAASVFKPLTTTAHEAHPWGSEASSMRHSLRVWQCSLQSTSMSRNASTSSRL